jgi:RND family efflux transporter MFP subunit
MLLGSCKQEQASEQKNTDETIPVKVMQLQTQSEGNVIRASGQFTTDDEVMLSFKTGGIIDHIYAREGTAVHKGQLLAVLKLTEIEAQVQQATLACEKARRDYERTNNLYRDSVATLEQLQNTKTMLDLAQQQLEAAKFNRNYSEIRAEKDGYILKKLANEGQMAAPGMPVFQTNGASSQSWLLRVGLSDRQWQQVNINDKAVVTTDAGSNKHADAIVVRKSQGTDPATGLFYVDVQLQGARREDYATGMFGQAMITTTAAKNEPAKTWIIPYEALLDADGSMGYVFKVTGNKVSKIKVTIQGIQKDHVVIADGLQDVSTIVTSGNAYLTDNSTVRIIQ